MLQFVTIVVFPALMIYAAISDLFTMTISNRISLALIVVFVPFAFAAGLSPYEVLLHLACGFGVLCLTFAMFAFGWIGGGDAKLAAATALWIGWQELGDYGVATALFGGLLTLAILQARAFPLPRFALSVGWLTRLHDRREGIPYGIALALGGLAVFPQTAIWAAGTIG